MRALLRGTIKADSKLLIVLILSDIRQQKYLSYCKFEDSRTRTIHGKKRETERRRYSHIKLTLD